MKELSEQEALHRAAAYCTATERCIQEVRKKIESAELDAEAIERIIARLIQEKFIDETRFARFFVNDKLQFNKWGRIKIGYELRRKGISSATCYDALDTIEEAEYTDILLALLKSKRKSVKAKDKREEYFKLTRFAAGRGFESQQINACLKKLFNGHEYEDME